MMIPTPPNLALAFIGSFNSSISSAYSEGGSYLNKVRIESNLSEVIKSFGEPLTTENARDWFDFIHRVA